jgi:hypothetical protein
MVLSPQNEHAFMCNVVYKRMLICNHFGVSAFIFHLKICLRNSSSNVWHITLLLHICTTTISAYGIIINKTEYGHVLLAGILYLGHTWNVDLVQKGRPKPKIIPLPLLIGGGVQWRRLVYPDWSGLPKELILMVLTI